MSQTNINLKITVFAQEARVRVVNINDFTGLDEEISAFGFTEKGEPVTSMEYIAQAKYRVTGLPRAGVNLNGVFARGLNADYKRVNGKLVSSGKAHGWDAVAMQLSRNGCSADPKEIQKQAEALIKSGISRVHFYRLANICGMQSDYGMFKDHWIVGDVPTVTYDVLNKLLKKISSPWRVQTVNTLKLLRKLELQKLISETEDV